jgi:Ohr subfamily peroxiredoxin
MTVDVKYEAHALAQGGRDGRARTLDGDLEVKLVIPRELGGPGGPGANPEKLFAMGYAACFLSALRSAASRDKLHLPDDATVESTIGIGVRSEGGYGLTVALAIHIPGWAPDDARILVLRAHQTCPYSNATRGNVEVKLSLPNLGGLIIGGSIT